MFPFWHRTKFSDRIFFAWCWTKQNVVPYLVDPCSDSNPVQVSKDHVKAWQFIAYLSVVRVAYPFSTFCSSPLLLWPPMIVYVMRLSYEYFRVQSRLSSLLLGFVVKSCYAPHRLRPENKLCKLLVHVIDSRAFHNLSCWRLLLSHQKVKCVNQKFAID